jgi:excinuclease ABC subunit C
VSDTPINLKEKVRQLPELPGVYLMKDRLGRIIYVGKARSLKKRVSTYFQRSRSYVSQPKIKALIDLIADFDIIVVNSEPEALLLEGKLIKQWKPRYNTDFIDDKRFLLIRVDLTEEMPKFRLTRIKKDDRSKYYGPFPHSGLLRKTLAQMRIKFGILLSDANPKKLPNNKWQLYDDVRKDIYGLENEISHDAYIERVNQACAFLDGKSHEWIESLKEEMSLAAKNNAFEKAAELRDVIIAMQKTLEKPRNFARTDPTGISASETALRMLAEALKLDGPPLTMECFDISHISGTFVVASMVHFKKGKPDKDQYRRFQIKSFVGNDDFRAMEEVVSRRYHRLTTENSSLPSLVVIDGGKGQIGSALKAFLSLGLTPPPLIGLAKKQETIIFPDERPPLNLPLSHPGLQLLQRIRDEAHRFANTYNAELRSKKIRESLLDEMPGLGTVRRNAVLNHFGDITKLKQASIEDIKKVPGFGQKNAEELHAYLKRVSKG